MKDSFHIRHQIRADFLLTSLEAVGIEKLAGQDLLQHVQSLGLSSRLLGEHLRWGNKLGLFSSPSIESPILSPLGEQLLTLSVGRRSIAYEILHFLHYSLWSDKNPGANRFSWTYRTLCQEITNARSLELNSKQLAGFIIMRAYEEFGLDESVSVSSDSVSGALEWMAHINPPVLDKRTLHVRQVCPEETFLMAVKAYYASQDLRIGQPLSITDEGRKAICTACLLDPGYFGSMARNTSTKYGVLEWVSSWGEIIRLKSDFEIGVFGA